MKRIRWLLVLLILLPLLCGCQQIFAELGIFSQYEEAKQIRYIRFSSDTEAGTPFDHSELSQYESEFSAFNSRVLYNTLTPAEQQVYRFFEYAMDHGYTTIFIDSRLLSGLEVETIDILEYLCMDSAFVPQNYAYSIKSTQCVIPIENSFQDLIVSGKEFEIDSFSPDKLEKKKEALEAARQLLQTLPLGDSPMENARCIYRYLCNEVTYHASEEDAPHNSLYDALIEKQAQCDGFANTFSLLCHLVGIPCFEKLYTPESKGEIGHTWNSFCIDGIWYNADCALSEDAVQDQKKIGIDIYFGFSDDRQEHPSQHAERLPACQTDLLPVSLIASSNRTPTFLTDIQNAFQATDKPYILIKLESGQLESSQLSELANLLRSSLYTFDFTWQDAHHHLLIKH